MPRRPHRALANKRQPQSLQLPRPGFTLALLDRAIEELRLMQNADAKPFVGSLTGLPPSTASSELREAAAMGGAGSRRSSAQSGQGFHRSPSQLNAVGSLYMPAGLSSYRTQEQATSKHYRFAMFGAQIAFQPQHDRQSECVLVPEETPRGNIRLSTAAHNVIQATVKKEQKAPPS
ncbi:hypothetical protein ABBQ38_009365 [Trebouxia sp. C0009 RCD-2024]